MLLDDAAAAACLLTAGLKSEVPVDDIQERGWRFKYDLGMKAMSCFMYPETIKGLSPRPGMNVSTQSVPK